MVVVVEATAEGKPHASVARVRVTMGVLAAAGDVLGAGGGANTTRGAVAEKTEAGQGRRGSGQARKTTFVAHPPRGATMPEAAKVRGVDAAFLL